MLDGRIIMAMPGQPRLALAIVFVMTVVATHAAQAQTFTVLHNFTGGADEGTPIAGLTIDQAGNFYGTTFGLNWGTVFKLAHKNSSWVLTPLYSFSGGDDGASPFAGVTIGLNGILYGTTFEGGTYGYGTVFDLKPSAAACRTALCPWTETVLCGFTGGSDGANPVFGDLVFDQAGNLYGTAEKGGAYGYGVVYELMPSNGGWTERVLYAFAGANDGAIPESALIFDKAGNLYGTAQPNRVDICGDRALGPHGVGSINGAILAFSGDIGPKERCLFSRFLRKKRRYGLPLSILANIAVGVVGESPRATRAVVVVAALTHLACLNGATVA